MMITCRNVGLFQVETSNLRSFIKSIFSSNFTAKNSYVDFKFGNGIIQKATFASGKPAAKTAAKKAEVVQRLLEEREAIDRMHKERTINAHLMKLGLLKPQPVRCTVLGIKEGSTMFWDEWGRRKVATIVSVPNNYVLAVTGEKEREKAKNKVSRAKITDIINGKVDRRLLSTEKCQVTIGCEPKEIPEIERRIREFGELGEKISEEEKLCQSVGLPLMKRIFKRMVSNEAVVPVGSAITTSYYNVGDKVLVRGYTIKKGFQGVVKRWGFKGLPATHGVSKKHRSPGSIGQCQTPGKVLKGKKMPGHMGGKLRMKLGCRIFRIDHDLKLLYLEGTVNGAQGDILYISDMRRKDRKPCGPLQLVSKEGIEMAKSETKQDPLGKIYPLNI